MTKWLHFHLSLSCTGEGNGNPLQCSCLESPRDGGAWWVAVYGVAQSRTWLKQLSSSSRWLRTLGPLISTTHLGQFCDNHDISGNICPFALQSAGNFIAKSSQQFPLIFYPRDFCPNTSFIALFPRYISHSSISEIWNLGTFLAESPRRSCWCCHWIVPPPPPDTEHCK